MRIVFSILSVIFTVVMLWAVQPAFAHFGTITPSDDIVTQDDTKTLTIQVKFIHPLEMHYMEMVKPKQFGVVHDGKKTDLIGTLQAAKRKSISQNKNFPFWIADFKIRRPGDYTFYVQPTPYWEPAEDKFIVHYTKACVNALGLEKGWDQPVGLETEIVPLTRPYGLWTGNLFTGKVMLKGKPASLAEVEIEYLNESPGNINILWSEFNRFAGFFEWRSLRQWAVLV